MKNYFKKMSLLLAVSSTIALTSSIGAFAEEIPYIPAEAFAGDNYVVGVSNLNNTIENSAIIGNRLFKPEKGWMRYNQDNSKITYDGIWYEINPTSPFDTQKTMTTGASVKFNFVGNKIRIIGMHLISESSNIEICIDGKKEIFSESNKNYNIPALVYEKLDLENTEHTVVITNQMNKPCDIDAIDINEGGELKLYSDQVATTTPAAVQATV